MLKKLFTFCCLTLLFLAPDCYSQGCSDAGICTMGSLNITRPKMEILKPMPATLKLMKEDDSLGVGYGLSRDSVIKIGSDAAPAANTPRLVYYSPRYSFQLSFNYGLGERSTSIVTTQFEGAVSLLKNKLSAQVKLPYTIVNGNLGTTRGPGDITVSMSYTALQKKLSLLSVSAGVKLPANDADLSFDGRPLPMVYQTSLGTTDLLVGMKYSYEKWDFTIGYQHPFNANENQYRRDSLTSDPQYFNYPVSNKFRRMDDVIFRFNRYFYHKKLSLSPGLLFIYHLEDDTYEDHVTGMRLNIKGSKGLTLNANLAGSVAIGKGSELVFLFGSPFITRQAKPEGLARAVVAVLGYKFSVY